MEAFSLLKYWQGGGAPLPPPSTASASAAATTTILRQHNNATDSTIITYSSCVRMEMVEGLEPLRYKDLPIFNL
ncbi:hypothetical protein S245_041324 [Arachis hypogaea]|uniref:Uncharacterized protein n=1 Tax=Arachis hypogaea TaxID=3818 RepID=A0A445E8W1_ARAHY|nr:uncharacterized protein DS421_12g380660 [Arachis hypogaea]RYR71891.1 hypothetical protein Ahy_A02g006101 isoform A [Arachis hypogaea]RYR71892.1 hypothetical protein Ahy_A02g006101 isoform B [Arachis hypogaea]